MKQREIHGMARSTEYRIWQLMHQRCENRKNPNFHNYGGRGITVCERWCDFSVFLKDMGPRPTLEHTLDRFPNNDGNYELENCRWATSHQQHNNKRTNHRISVNGETKTVTEWARAKGMKYHTLTMRLYVYGWNEQRAVTTPVYKGGSH
jgi:hypothetical protein